MDKFAFHFEKQFMTEEGKKPYRLIFWIMIIFYGGIFSSCANEDCVSVFNNNLLVGFLKLDTLESGEIVEVAVDTIFYEVMATGNDSILYGPETVINSLLTLPVDPASDITSFRMDMLDSISYDTLSTDPIIVDTTYHVNPVPHIITVSYRRTQRIITENCGVEITYTGLEIEEITFPVTNLVDDKLSRFNEVNIEVFF